MSTARAHERLRQERETFDQAQRHDADWFRLRLAMGYTAITLLGTIAAFAGYVLLLPENYSRLTIDIAAATLFLDIVGLITTIFKLVLRQNSTASLKPITVPQD